MSNKYALDNGLRIVTEYVPYVKKAAVGIWVGAGSVHETIDNNGISHYIEHMLFKGTDKRENKKQIMLEIDDIGGKINGATGENRTFYYIETPSNRLGDSFDILADMFRNSKLRNEDIKSERNVILEEMNISEDDPSRMLKNLMSKLAWKDNPLAYSPVGKRESIEKIDRQSMIEYMKNYYTPDNTVISIAGNFDEKYFLNMVKESFDSWEGRMKTDANAGEIPFIPEIGVKHKDMQKVNIMFGFDGFKSLDDRIYSLKVLNSIFAGGMSSRLFQKIREENSLVYSISGYDLTYKNAGLYLIDSVTSTKNVDKVIDGIASEITDLVKNKMTKEEISRGKNKVKSAYTLGFDSMKSIMKVIGQTELLENREFSIEEICRKIDEVNWDTVTETINAIFAKKPPCLALVGCRDVVERIREKYNVHDLIRHR